MVTTIYINDSSQIVMGTSLLNFVGRQGTRSLALNPVTAKGEFNQENL